jgi:hypothetical protein
MVKKIDSIYVLYGGRFILLDKKPLNAMVYSFLIPD